MSNYIKYIVVLLPSFLFLNCSKDDPETNKTSFQILADKEKELNDREARLKLKEIELEERERKLGYKNSESGDSADEEGKNLEVSEQTADSMKVRESIRKKEVKKEIQKEISKRFENPAGTVKDYYEYIQRGINEEGSFDSNMKKAQRYFPSRTVDKLKSGYRNTKQFTVISEPKVISQKENKAVVVAKVRQTQILKKDGNEKEITKDLRVTYNLRADQNGEWVIVSNSVKEE
ncbi:MAG: hypothetical protein N2510_01875 [Ignavibacteria bacterium]|nr:hypothetical protein [Ignavibacteria bacterium]